MNLKTAFFLFCLIFPFGNAIGVQTATLKVGLSVWTGYPESVRGFKEAMTEGGYIEGQNVEYLYRESGIDRDKQREIAEEFRRVGVDLVYSLTTPGTSIVKETLPETTPIVFSIVTYPADSGLIESFEYSGNNLVGTSNYVELTSYVELLTTMLPDTKTVAIFHRKGEPNSKFQAANIIRLLKSAGIKAIDLEPESVEQTVSMAEEHVGRADVFMTTTDTLMQGGGEAALLEISLANKIPILSSNKKGIEAGSTFGPVSDFYVLGKMSGEMAVKILREDARPTELASAIQETPLTLINRDSLNILGIEFSENELSNFQYVE